MTYDIYPIDKKGKEIPSVMAIHGMAYGAKKFDWAEPYIYSDKILHPSEVKRMGLEFHKRFVEYCISIRVPETTEIGSDSTGIYYDYSKLNKDSIQKFEVCLRFLQCYLIAIALGCGLKFA